jgi:hypothetical protein
MLAHFPGVISHMPVSGPCDDRMQFLGQRQSSSEPPLATIAQCHNRNPVWVLEMIQCQSRGVMPSQAKARSRANSAPSGLPFNFSLSGACQSLWPCSAVSELRRHTEFLCTPDTADASCQIVRPAPSKWPVATGLNSMLCEDQLRRGGRPVWP